MRPFEIAVLATMLPAIFGLYISRNKRPWWLRLLPGGALLLILIHVAVEEYRWQMAPTYVLAGLVFIASSPSLFQTSGSRVETKYRRALRVIAATAGIILLLACSSIPVALPVFDLPVPGGPHAVGTTYFFFVDESRPDVFASKDDAFREISVRAWYPAQSNPAGQPVPYMTRQEGQFMAQALGAPAFVLDHFALVSTHSYLDASPLVTAAPYPVVLYSPSGEMTQNTVMFEELASRGYAVLSVGHPYWSFFTYDAERRARGLDIDNEHYKRMWEEERSDAVIATKEEVTTARTLEAKDDAFRKLNRNMPEESRDVRLWSEDLGFVADRISELNGGESPLAGRLDVSRVGAIGFSKGGVAAGQFCVDDERCAAGINLSGFMFGDVVEASLKPPFMILESVEPWCDDCLPINEPIYERVLSDAYVIQIDEARHGNFSDWSLVGPWLEQLGMTGPIDGDRFLTIQNEYVLAFFDTYLRGNPASLLEEQPPPWQEVKFMSRQ